VTRTPSRSDPEATRACAIEIARTMEDLKCTELTVLDVRGQSQVCDYMVIASGTSVRQMRSLAEECEDLGKSRGFPVYRSSRDEGTTWIVVDLVEIVVHIFEPEQRLYYDLELLWGDAKRVEWRRPEGSRPPASKHAE
jgi:ribosome-associated protein